MHCPFCDNEDTRVVDSRLAMGGASIRRRRECTACKRRFWTFERYEIAPLLVVKKDGSREDFEREKVLNGVLRACQKRPVSYQILDDMVSALERDLRATGEVEVSSEVIGERVMEGLRKIDEVAYVRFASVYKEFKDISRFSEELNALRESRERFSIEEKQ